MVEENQRGVPTEEPGEKGVTKINDDTEEVKEESDLDDYADSDDEEYEDPETLRKRFQEEEIARNDAKTELAEKQAEDPDSYFEME